jgi:hypothetical protein
MAPADSIIIWLTLRGGEFDIPEHIGIMVCSDMFQVSEYKFGIGLNLAPSYTEYLYLKDLSSYTAHLCQCATSYLKPNLHLMIHEFLAFAIYS